MDRLGMTVPVAGETMAELPAVLDELAAAGYSDIWTSEVNATDAFAPLLLAAQRVRGCGSAPRSPASSRAAPP